MRKGQHLSDEMKKRLSESRKGIVISKEHRKKISETMKEWHRTHKHPMLGRKHSEETKRKIGAWGKGKKHTLEDCRKISKSNKGRKNWCRGLTKETDERVRRQSEKMKINNPKYWKGREFSLEHRINISKGQKGSEGWTGFSFEPYTVEFNKKLKLAIRQRDNFTCQQCRQTEEELGYILGSHHIDYNKKNNDPSNLISLCKVCHGQTNFSRDDWTDYFNKKLRGVF